MDVDPVAHDKAQVRIEEVLHSRSGLMGKTLVRNFRGVKHAIGEVDENLLESGVDAILMDLGMSSMQVFFLKILHFPVLRFCCLANFVVE